MSATRQVMFTISRVFGLRSAIGRRTRSNATRADLIKQLHRENKQLFGELVETRKQKNAREKREKKLLESESSAIDLSSRSDKGPGVDTEAYYLMNEKIRKLQRLGSEWEFETRQTKKSLKSDETKESGEGISCAKISSDKIVDDKVEIVDAKSLSLPSNIPINRITSFSYLNREKHETNDRSDGDELHSISPYDDKSKLFIPSVTKILNRTMSAQSKLNLELWKKRMITELGEEGFQKYSQELLTNGKDFHTSIQNSLTDKPYDVPSTVEKSFESVKHVLKNVERPKAIESHVVHSQLHYRGIVDCVAVYRGKLCVIDWKKSDKPKTSIENTYDAPIQVASYVGALNSDSNYKFQVRNGLVVVGYTNGDPASVHEIDPDLLSKYWILWLRRLQQYHIEVTTGDRIPTKTVEE